VSEGVVARRKLTWPRRFRNSRIPLQIGVLHDSDRQLEFYYRMFSKLEWVCKEIPVQKFAGK
jgi:hypothetical protein